MISLTIKIAGNGRIEETHTTVEEGLTYEDLFDILDLNPEAVVALKEGIPIPADDFVEAGEIEIVHVVSSG